jgi:hypothetical protein
MTSCCTRLGGTGHIDITKGPRGGQNMTGTPELEGSGHLSMTAAPEKEPPLLTPQGHIEMTVTPELEAQDTLA